MYYIKLEGVSFRYTVMNHLLIFKFMELVGGHQNYSDSSSEDIMKNQYYSNSVLVGLNSI